MGPYRPVIVVRSTPSYARVGRPIMDGVLDDEVSTPYRNAISRREGTSPPHADRVALTVSGGRAPASSAHLLPSPVRTHRTPPPSETRLGPVGHRGSRRRPGRSHQRSSPTAPRFDARRPPR